MAINILPPDVSSKIAAGEVVERPASVVKELIENSLDAGATQIVVEVRGGGVSFVRVSDNGVGIPSSEIERAFHRYATSKIETIGDLETVSTLGFRGEALHSIAAVAQVDIVTHAKGGKEIGSYLALRDGVVVERSSRGRPQGTTVTVRELFRRVPARLKFLKSVATENNHIVDVVTRRSLAFPEVRFVLFIDGRTVLRTSGSGILRDVLVEIYGLETARAMMEVGGSEGGGKGGEAIPLITGLVSPPSINRASRGHLNFFVNRRWVRSAMLARAVEEAYHGLLMVGRYPFAIINISISPREVDVNVHPTKSEVKFSHEQVLFTAVQSAVRRVVAEQAPVKVFPVGTHPGFHPPLPEQGRSIGILEQKEAVARFPLFSEGESSVTVPILRVVGQMANAYIIAEGNDGLYLIDQHAAHERVLFDRIREQRARQKVEVQGLLEPVTIEINAQQEGLLKSRGNILAHFGFTIEPFGERTYLVRSVPAVLQQMNVTQVVVEILDSLEDKSSLESQEESIAISLACHGAVRAGQVLSQEEMRGLIRQLEQTNLPRTCPHGRPTMIHLSSLQLAREFGRTSPVSQ